MALSALDLPALERPAKATSAPKSGGHSSSREALIKKRALLKETQFGVRSGSTAVGFPLDFSYQGLMYNATPIPGGALCATAVSPGFEPDWSVPAGCVAKNTLKR